MTILPINDTGIEYCPSDFRMAIMFIADKPQVTLEIVDEGTINFRCDGANNEERYGQISTADDDGSMFNKYKEELIGLTIMVPIKPLLHLAKLIPRNLHTIESDIINLNMNLEKIEYRNGVWPKQDAPKFQTLLKIQTLWNENEEYRKLQYEKDKLESQKMRLDVFFWKDAAEFILSYNYNDVGFVSVKVWNLGR